MLKNDSLLGIDLFWPTGIIFLIGLFYVSHMAFKCLDHPKDKNRPVNLLLLILLLLHNGVINIFPNKSVNLPDLEQQLLCYTARLAVLAYFPFYFYKLFTLRTLKFLAQWGVLAFLIGPIFISISFTKLALACVTATAVSYSFILIISIGTAIQQGYKSKTITNSKEARLFFTVVVSWGLMVIISPEIGQLGELIISSTGLIFFCIFNKQRELHSIKKHELDILQLREQLIATQNPQIVHPENRIKSKPESSNFDIDEEGEDAVENDANNRLFEENCNNYLTDVQIEVIKMVNQNFTYKEIAIEREESEDWIKEIMSNIGRRLMVKGRRAILMKLKSNIKDIKPNTQQDDSPAAAPLDAV